MKIAIKNPAPIGPNLTKWGDYHFGSSLQQSLERLGVEVVQHYWPEWTKSDGADVVLVLRGKRRYVSTRDEVRLLWVLSHPATVSLEELSGYQVAYVASETHQRMFGADVPCPVRVMRQCTDSTLFFRGTEKADVDRRGVVFVANSRGVVRDIIQWGMDAGLPPSVIGRHWGGTKVQPLVGQEYIENADLPALYRASRLSLNDHWGDMLHYGVINNRVFDCLACGIPVLSDSFPELRAVCGDGITSVKDATTYESAFLAYTLRYPDLLERTQRTWERLEADYTFDSRAQRLVDDIGRLSAGGAGPGSSARRHQSIPSGNFLTVREHCPEGTNVLHVLPSLELTQSLSALDGVNYVSAGLGLGPWHVALTIDARQLIPGKFDLLIVENVESLLRMPARQEFFDSLSRQLSRTGKVLLLAPLEDAEQLDWNDAGFGLHVHGPSYVVLSRT